MNKLDLAQALIAIAKTGSISKAADELHQTTAAVSKKLSKLESYLDTQLVIRERTGLVLSEAGMRYVYEAQKALVQIKLAEESVSSIKSKPQGLLRVISNLYYAQKVIIPNVCSFYERYPKIKLMHSTEEIAPDFKARKMDILVGVSIPGPVTVTHHAIDTTRHVVCATPAYLEKNKNHRFLQM